MPSTSSSSRKSRGGKRSRGSSSSSRSSGTGSGLSSTKSAPDYRVEQDKLGRLINREKRLIWPSEVPCQQFDSVFDGEVETEPDSVSVEKVAEEASNLDLNSNQSLSNISMTSSCNIVSESDAFIGGATANQAEKQIGYRSFVLYYRMPSDGTIPFSMPLTLVYRSTQNQHFHFKVNQRRKYDVDGKLTHTFYSVKCGDCLEFLSLETLIRHYETFVYHDIANGTMETFPVNSTEGSIFDVFK